MSRRCEGNGGDCPVPATPPEAGRMPHGLTFFLESRERARVLRALRRFDRDRRTALLRALRVRVRGPERSTPGGSRDGA
jgi:hypothetical protein